MRMKGTVIVEDVPYMALSHNFIVAEVFGNTLRFYPN